MPWDVFGLGSGLKKQTETGLDYRRALITHIKPR